MESSEPSALDKLMGTSPHFAAATEFGVFCPACSDPFKLSFVSASSCPLAALSSSRTDIWGDISVAMVAAGLSILPPSERSKQIELHQRSFKREQERWREQVRKEHCTDSL